MYRQTFIPPGGVGIQQTQQGWLLITYGISEIEPLRAALDKLRADLLDSALEAARVKLAEEKKRQQLPADRISLLSGEVQALEKQRIADAAALAALGHPPSSL